MDQDGLGSNPSGATMNDYISVKDRPRRCNFGWCGQDALHGRKYCVEHSASCACVVCGNNDMDIQINCRNLCWDCVGHESERKRQVEYRSYQTARENRSWWKKLLNLD